MSTGPTSSSRSRARATGCLTRPPTVWPTRSPGAYSADRSGRGAGQCGRFRTAADVELGQDVRHVDADRLLADVELVRDLPVGARLDEQCQHLALAVGEGVQPGGEIARTR